MHGAGSRIGEGHLESVAMVEGTPEGLVRVLTSSTEIGQGTNTIFSQIAAEALGIECDDIEVVSPDTTVVPNSGPTVASRTCMVVGKLVETAALGVRHALIDAGYLRAFHSRAEFQTACKHYVDAFGSLRATISTVRPRRLDDDKSSGPRTALGGRRMSPSLRRYDEWKHARGLLPQKSERDKPLAAGQIEGGVAQARLALFEAVVWSDGRMANATMTN